jgi:hypothetical protein
VTTRYAHALIVGGTGMLRDASCEIARRSTRLTSVARTTRSLEALDAHVRREPFHHHLLQLDWGHPGAFLEAIAAHLERIGPPDLVVAWIHDDDLALRLGSAVARGGDGGGGPFLHVIGSQTENPLTMAGRLAGAAATLRIPDYRQVVLGARPGRGEPRWLRDREISEGVVDALSQGAPRWLVGSLDAWNLRPEEADA